MKNVSMFVILALACSSLANAQDASAIPTRQALHQRETRSLFQSKARYLGKHMICTEDASLYLSIPEDKDDRRHTLYHLDAAGHPKAFFSLATVPGLNRALNFDQYAVGPKGEVVMLASTPDSAYFVKFGPDGTYDSQIRLGEWINPANIAVFPNGSILAAFRKRSEKPEERHPVTRIYDASGKIVADFKLPDDDQIQQAVNDRDSRYVSGMYPDQSNRPVDWGEAVTGPDGNVYLMRWMSPAIIYVINSSGKLLRRLEIQPPEFDMLPSHIHVSKGKISLLFNPYDDLNSSLVSVNDWTNGQTLKLYDASGVGNDLACYEPSFEKMSFVRLRDHKVHVHQLQVGNPDQK